MAQHRATADSPFGPLTLTERDGWITGVFWGGGGDEPTLLLAEAIGQLERYFAGTLTSFDLPLDPGTGFAARMRAEMRAIPYGETRTYGDLAKVLGVQARAVGQACGANPMPILVPCHRVLGVTTLGGFSAPGGVETKVALLRHERAAGLLI
jgi:methylated-DNA-[protein]-cysteine S-methyltransferase